MKDDLAALIDYFDASRLSPRALFNRSAATVIGASALGTSGCAEEPKNGGTLRIGLGGGDSSDTLDPALADALVWVSADNKVEMRLVDKITPNADGSKWTFGIRKGVKFHGGTEMTADDVVATFKRHSDENVNSGALGTMTGIKDIKADGQNVTPTMTGPNADLPYLLADYHLVIQPKGGVDDPAAGIGTGPHKVTVQDAGVRYAFEKNADDWDANRGYYDGVEILAINDSTARNAALQSGQIHMVNRVDPRIARMLGSRPDVQVSNSRSRALIGKWSDAQRDSGLSCAVTSSSSPCDSIIRSSASRGSRDGKLGRAGAIIKCLPSVRNARLPSRHSFRSPISSVGRPSIAAILSINARACAARDLDNSPRCAFTTRSGLPAINRSVTSAPRGSSPGRIT